MTPAIPVQVDGPMGSKASLAKKPIAPASDRKEITYAKDNHVLDLESKGTTGNYITTIYSALGRLHMLILIQ